MGGASTHAGSVNKASTDGEGDLIGLSAVAGQIIAAGFGPTFDSE